MAVVRLRAVQLLFVLDVKSRVEQPSVLQERIRHLAPNLGCS